MISIALPIPDQDQQERTLEESSETVILISDLLLPPLSSAKGKAETNQASNLFARILPAQLCKLKTFRAEPEKSLEHVYLI